MENNVALNKCAYQSSFSRWSSPGESCGAVNGKKDGGYSFHTDIEDHAWWQLDLGFSYDLHSIVVFNRGASGSDLSKRALSLQIYTSVDGMIWKLLFAGGRSFGGKLDNKPLFVACISERARFIRLQLAERNYLHLDEVEVYADDKSESLYQLRMKYGIRDLESEFCDIYDGIFLSVRARVTKVLDISAKPGERLSMWRDWFINAEIHGADCCVDHEKERDGFHNTDDLICDIADGDKARIHLHHLRQPSRADLDLKSFADKHLNGSFDLLVVHGDRDQCDRQRTLSALLRLVKPGGFFVIELPNCLRAFSDTEFDIRDSAIHLIERVLAGHDWHSETLTSFETEFLRTVVDTTHTTIQRFGNSAMCVIRRRTTIESFVESSTLPGSVAIINYATFDQHNQKRQQQHLRWAKQWAQDSLQRPDRTITTVDITCFGPDTLDAEFCERNAAILRHRRGGGYWLWKPYVITAMLAASNAEFVLYCDCGSTLQKPLEDVLDVLRMSGAAILAFDLTSNGWLEHHWTKGQVLRAMAATDPLISETGQLGATVSVWRVCDASRKLAQAWLTLLQNPEFATDIPSADGGSESADFREHRHDQSVFSILIKKEILGSHQKGPIAITRDFRSWVGHHYIS